MPQGPPGRGSRGAAATCFALGGAAVLWGVVKGFAIGAATEGQLAVTAGLPLLLGVVLLKFATAFLDRD